MEKQDEMYRLRSMVFKTPNTILERAQAAMNRTVRERGVRGV